MQYGENFENALEIAESALSAMQRYKVTANPENFTVWYTHLSGSFPDLSSTIEGLISQGEAFTTARNAELFERFFGQSSEGAAVEETSARVHDAMTQIMAILEDAGRSTADFGDKLAEAGGKLEGGPTSIDQLRAIISEILAETRQMEERNRKLETRLSDSSKEIAELRQNLETVRREAMTDALTGIANRKYFDLRLREAARRATERTEPLALLMIDIDYFKNFNDTYGHQLGDQVLRLVARCLVDCTKGQDTPARYGGEEFGIVLPETELRNANILAEQVRETVSSKKIYKRSTNQDLGIITISVGVAAFKSGEPLSSFIQRADEALYEAKRKGRNKVIDETQLETVATA